MNYLMVVQPIEQYQNKENFCMPLGIAYVNGAMRAAGFHVDGINMMFVDGDPYQALQKKIIDYNIDVLLCGGLTSEYPILKQVFGAARKANPEILLIGGGGGFTSEPIVFSELTGVDAAVIGEGEITNVELARAMEAHEDLSKISGIVYFDGEIYRQTPPRPIIQDIDSLPFPSYEGLAMKEYLERQQVDGWYNYFTYYSDRPRLMPMMMSRSCPYNCSFCFHPIGNGYRARSINNFFQELDLWVEKYHINGIALVDECFSMNAQTVQEFCRRIKPYGLAWACQMRAEVYTEEMISAMKDSGCIGACFGIESMSQIVLNNMQKHLKPETIEKALRLSYQYHVGASGNLIFGAETETFDSVYESLCWNRHHRDQCRHQPINSFNYIQTYPGSTYYDNALQRRIIQDKAQYIKDNNWTINITSMSEKEYRTLGEVARLLQHEPRDEGKVLDLHTQPDGRLTLTFQCPHCSSTHTYHNLSPNHLREGRVRGLGCRTCNGMGDYVLEPERFPFQHYITVDWLLNQLEAVHVPEYMARKGWRRIGILGATYAADKLIRLLEKATDVEIVCILTRKGRSCVDGQYPLVSELPGDTVFDVLIDAEMVHTKWLWEHTSSLSGTTVVSLETVLRETVEKLPNTVR